MSTALELLANADHAVLGVRNHARQELAGVQLHGHLFTVFTLREVEVEGRPRRPATMLLRDLVPRSGAPDVAAVREPVLLGGVRDERDRVPGPDSGSGEGPRQDEQCRQPVASSSEPVNQAS